MKVDVTNPARGCFAAVIISAGALLAGNQVFAAGAAKATGKAPAKEAAKSSTPPAAEVLEKAEAIRNPTDDYSVDVELHDKKDGKVDVRKYESFIKGRDKALVKFVEPVSESGTRVLMTGPDMYVFVPTSAKPVRVSANQKLTGNAAYGDVARLSFVGNYKAEHKGMEKVGGKDAYVLDLNSLPGRPVTYDKILYWVDAKTMYPLKAHYMTQSGKVIREGTFEDYADVFGVQRPRTFVLKNALRTDHVTVLKFSNPKKKSMPDLMFEKQNLGRN
ncbi:MAG: hypothetical protein RIQ81_1091 [Pseudomonadota bacterium]|jgi:outer membrane lipoprotein-sorting protein